MEAGRIANNQLAKLVGAKAPLMLKGYVNTPLGKLIIANLAQLALERFQPNNTQAAVLSKAMMVQAYQEVIQLIDVEGVIDELLSDAKISKALAKVGPGE